MLLIKQRVQLHLTQLRGTWPEKDSKEPLGALYNVTRDSTVLWRGARRSWLCGKERRTSRSVPLQVLELSGAAHGAKSHRILTGSLVIPVGPTKFRGTELHAPPHLLGTNVWPHQLAVSKESELPGLCC